ncbi:hypothetical protein SmJEL517_g04020 [Synchytrium microbalum]|uniref:Aldehyde dehydrogenase domain-containing protein n=1 Tax=Synchytrium microbalum TaxID=1806994 RepID=A0A507BU45_9FUNG|nr:uncharacterized protein SmJEL517_g04020 [Synchytrium microbalum]TPX33030.1 hypothetical protein SmJEL517_g04020 [Synchytrium microbalum]
MVETFNRDTHITVTTTKGVDYSVPSGLFINGQFVKSVSGKKFASVNPSNGKVFAEFYEGDKADIDLAVKSAKAAYKSWSKVTPAERGRLIFKFCDLFERDKQIFAELESMDMGKTVKDMLSTDVPDFLACMRYYAGWADKIHGKVVDVDPSLQTYTRHEPMGVVGQIIPWNYPLVMASWKLGPALSCGNCVVLKTSEKSPCTALKMMELWTEAGLPPGVLNIVSGYGPTAGSALASHMDVSKIAFTGSTGVGRKILAAAASSNLKKVTLELGGKSPNIVFKDADLDKAAYWCSIGIFSNHGQACSAGSRIFVHADIYDAFLEKLKETAQKLKVGDPTSEDTDQGPLVDELQFNRVMNYIEQGKKAGARVVCGGERNGTVGFFVKPTVFADCDDSMIVVKEEIFGPVVVCLKFTDFDEVMERANSTSYGLAAAVHTQSLPLAFKAVNALEAGSVWVNAYHLGPPSMPFGGYKQSGIGRELGKYALAEYTQVKAV